RRQTVQLNQPEASEPVPTPVITELPAPSRPTSQDTPETDVVDNAVAENVEALESSSAPEGGDTSTAASATARDSVAETDTTPPPEVTPASSADTETNTDTARDTNAAAETQSEPPATIEPAPEVEAPVRDAPPTGAASGQLWAVQLGSFGDPANAQRLAASVREYGMIAFVSEVESNGRTMHRVRIGPQASRAESDAIVNRLRDEGTDARVVAYP
ncbi:MAG: SPOR domain-containing protein, partial [Pseudomonadota bacterium]